MVLHYSDIRLLKEPQVSSTLCLLYVYKLRLHLFRMSSALRVEGLINFFVNVSYKGVKRKFAIDTHVYFPCLPFNARFIAGKERYDVFHPG